MRKDIDRLPPLDLLLAFEAAARHLSFTRAAAERFVTQSAVSRQIRALEDDLGVALFARQHRALVLTPAGEKLLLACQNMLAQMRRTVAGIRAPAAREVLGMSTTPSFASLWLIPRLRDFTQANPGVDVRIDASYEIRDLRADGFDIAVRYQRANAGDGEPLFSESMLAVCAPSLLKAVRGTLWVTIDNDPRDIVLDPGESFVVDSDRPLFVMALGDRATLDVCTDSLLREPATPPRHPWLAGLWSRQPAGAVAQVGLRGAAAA